MAVGPTVLTSAENRSSLLSEGFFISNLVKVLQSSLLSPGGVDIAPLETAALKS